MMDVREARVQGTTPRQESPSIPPCSLLVLFLPVTTSVDPSTGAGEEEKTTRTNKKSFQVSAAHSTDYTGYMRAMRDAGCTSMSHVPAMNGLPL
jgi:hypothetical protein